MSTYMNLGNVRRGDASAGRWVWLLPLAYALHVVEEAFGGRGFAGWLAEHGGVRFSIASFLGANLVGLVLITAATWGARRSRAWTWTLVSGGVILFVNGISHVAASAAMGYYVPGMWTGVAIYLPLGGMLVVRGRRTVSGGAFWAAVAVGFVIHAAVLWVVFGTPGLRP